MLSRLGQRLRAVPADRFVHVGNGLAVCASMSDDMIQLRSFMIGATCCNMAFNLLQSPPLLTPCYWGTFFIAVHSGMIAKTLREKRPIEMSERESEAYERAFLPHGWTPRLFLALLAGSNGEFVQVDANGPALAQQGEPRRFLHLITSGPGACVVLHREEGAEEAIISRIKAADLARDGLWVGDCVDLEREPEAPETRPTWRATVRSDGGSLEGLRFDADLFHDTVNSLGDKAVQAAENMQIAALRKERKYGAEWQARMRASNRERARALEQKHLRDLAEAQYRAMVALAVADGWVAVQERDVCLRFREAHGITQEQHDEALRDVDWVGRPF